jgi:hypothetical protein
MKQPHFNIALVLSDKNLEGGIQEESGNLSCKSQARFSQSIWEL